MAQGTVTTQPQGRSFIIKRPRLTKLLDESEARIVLLVAPAGYGKTTLAREWVAGKEGVVWYSGKPAMADVAALAAELAATLSRDDEAAHAALERVNVLASRDQPPATLAQAVIEVASPRWSLLVIDDCHYAAGSADSEELLREVIDAAAERVVLTSRVRPEWIEPRMLIYGDVAVFGMAELAFTDEEAQRVLSASGAPETDLSESAHGWPAVVGLAAQTRGSRPDGPTTSVDLYEFFAEDLFRRAPEHLRTALMLLALGGDCHRDVSAMLFGHDLDEILAMAADHGFIGVRPDETQIHPLLRGFLLAKLQGAPADEIESAVRRVIDALTRRELWDECLVVLEFSPVPDLITSVLTRALTDLLDTGRIPTLRRWLALANSAGSGSEIFLLAEAEVALRDQDDAKAQAMGERAGMQLRGDLAARAFIVASRAAHLRDDREAVVANAELAQSSAESVHLKTVALWTEFASAAEWSNADALVVWNRLRALPDPRPEHALRVLNAQTWLLMDGEGDLRAAVEKCRLAHALIPTTRDPFLATGVYNIFGHLNLLLAEYEDALQLADILIDEARVSRLEFAIDHALVTRAGALIGLRKFSAAERALKELDDRAINATDHIAGNALLQHVRLHIATGDLEKASGLLDRDPPSRLPRAFKGEHAAYRGLVLAALGNIGAASIALTEAESLASYIATRRIAQMGHAVIASQTSGDAAAAVVISALNDAGHAGHLDAIVTAARAFPDLVRLGSGDAACARALKDTLTRSGDVDIGRRAGLPMKREFRRGEGLSPREWEVYELMIRGRTNKEIAQTLFISESTTKVHVRHIFEKLGVHRRTEAATAPIRPARDGQRSS